LFDPEHNWIYRTDRGFSRSRNSPFQGRQMQGKVVLTVYNGKPAYKDLEVLKSRQKNGCPS
jgi:dihydroorotase